MFHRRSTVKGSLSFSNPAVRAWLFQILAVIAVISIAVYLIHNTINNLNNSGITSGFSFLDRSAGFGIVQHLIDYEQGDTYGRVFVVGLLNTLLVSALCIVFASILGFFLGLARLSDNWLLRKLSTIYIETFRNIPPLLQIFFWYFAVLRNLPGPRQAVNALDLMFLSNRGLYIPAPQMGEGFFAFAPLSLSLLSSPSDYFASTECIKPKPANYVGPAHGSGVDRTFTGDFTVDVWRCASLGHSRASWF